MQQDGGPPDLTKWLPHIVAAFLLLYNGWEVVKRGWKGRKDDRAKEITEAVEKWKNAYDEAEALAKVRKERLDEREKELAEEKQLNEQLRSQIRERGRIEADLQKDLMALQGDYDDMERRLRALEGGKSSGGRR